MIVSDRRDEITEEVTGILESYDVFGHDVETILNRIDEAYDLCEKVNTVGTQLEAFVLDELGREGYNKFLRIVAGQESAGANLKKVL